jgi:hypothetical protein
MTRLKNILKDKKGLSIPLTVAVTLSLIMMFTAISEYMRLSIIAKGVRDSLQSAVIAAVNDNYKDVYHGVREGYAGGYQPNAGGFAESVNHGDIWRRLDNLLGLRSSGGGQERQIEDGYEFRLSDLNIEVWNTPLAPSDPTNAQRFTANAAIKLEVPVRFAGANLPPLTIHLKVQAGWITKF